MCIHPHKPKKHTFPPLRAMKYVNTLSFLISFKLFKHDCQHSSVIYIVKSSLQRGRKDTGSSPRHTSIGYLLGTVLAKRAGNLSMIPALRGEGLPGTCFISTTHLSFSVPHPSHPSATSSFLSPSSRKPRYSNFPAVSPH